MYCTTPKLSREEGVMIELTGEQAADFFRRCYMAVDGLWCMKVEERYGFETALEVDNAVWQVFPKIQARKLKELTKLGNGIEALRECFTTKLSLEGYSYEVESVDNRGGFQITIDRCPGHDAMIDSGREKLSPRVGSAICPTEYSVWASEFGDDIRWEQLYRLCEGSETCVVQFTRS
jgi:hypothetical protein